MGVLFRPLISLGRDSAPSGQEHGLPVVAVYDTRFQKLLNFYIY